MALIEINRTPSQRDLRVFCGIWFPLFVALIGAVVFSRTGSIRGSIVIWAGGTLISLLGWFIPDLARAMYLGWMYASYPLGWIVSHAFMLGIFYLVITPIGLFMRWRGRDVLRRKVNRSSSTYWAPRDSASDLAKYFRQF